jgi:hypothetical protein
MHTQHATYMHLLGVALSWATGAAFHCERRGLVDVVPVLLLLAMVGESHNDPTSLLVVHASCWALAAAIGSSSCHVCCVHRMCMCSAWRSVHWLTCWKMAHTPYPAVGCTVSLYACPCVDGTGLKGGSSKAEMAAAPPAWHLHAASSVASSGVARAGRGVTPLSPYCHPTVEMPSLCGAMCWSLAGCLREAL